MNELFEQLEEAKQAVKSCLESDNTLVGMHGLGEGVSWGDDDIYAYIRPDEAVPEMGETYKLDNDTWYRVA